MFRAGLGQRGLPDTRFPGHELLPRLVPQLLRSDHRPPGQVPLLLRPLLLSLEHCSFIYFRSYLVLLRLYGYLLLFQVAYFYCFKYSYKFYSSLQNSANVRC